MAQVEICDNALDDDGDGFIDLNDSDCLCGGVLTLSDTGLVSNFSMEHTTGCITEKWAYMNPLPIDDWPVPSDPGNNGSTDWFDANCGAPLYGGLDDAIASHADAINQPILGDVFQGAQVTDDWREYMSFNLHSPALAGVEHCFNFWLAETANTDYLEGDCEMDPFTPYPMQLFGSNAVNADGSHLGGWAMGTTCPTGYEKLGAPYVNSGSTDEVWDNHCFCFTPTVDINSMYFGMDCEEIPGYNGYPDKACTLYQLFDNFVISADISCTGVSFAATVGVEGGGQSSIDAGNAQKPCSGAFALEGITDTMDCPYQWYLEDIAIVGQSGTSVKNFPHVLDVEALVNAGSLSPADGIGQYTFRVDCGIDGATCDDFTVTTAGPSLSEEFAVRPVCNGQCDGIIQVNSYGGNPNYTIDWTSDIGGSGSVVGVAGDVTFDPLCPAIYDMTITDALLCTGVLVVDLAATAPVLLENPTVNPETCTTDCDGSIDITATGGTYTPSYSPVVEYGDVDKIKAGEEEWFEVWFDPAA
ncbi:MAG: hypothetical protein HRT72_02390, partial [Flavobacteriales bacterium]|nr:hypothetical protein [Flavobacteriales bacterium]